MSRIVSGHARLRGLGAWVAYLTNLNDPTPDAVIGAYRNLFKIETASRMAKSDLAVRPVYHHLLVRHALVAATAAWIMAPISVMTLSASVWPDAM
jgi:hypothetical protein